jgi:hypothetical protein
MSLRMYQGTKKLFVVKTPGTASIGDVAKQISRHMKPSPWTNVTIRRSDVKDFWIEDGGRYQVETTYDEEADTRLRLRIRYDAPDRTFFVETIGFDATKDLNQLLEDLRQKLGFEPPRPTQCSFTSTPWTDGQEIRITTQVTKLYESATKEPFRRRSSTIELEDGIWQSGEVLSPMGANREQVWRQLRLLEDLPELAHFKIVHGNLDITGI